MASREPASKSLPTFALAAVLVALLAAAIWFAIYTWAGIDGPPTPPEGYVALTFGALFSLIVGIGLMALMFYSSRHGYDQPPRELPPDKS
jgi:formate hydrogenlyase subunit 3/multisubunit Na+/H+ antiporter MnhD subunit